MLCKIIFEHIHIERRAKDTKLGIKVWHENGKLSTSWYVIHNQFFTSDNTVF